MDAQELISKYSPFVKRNILILSLGALGMIFFAYGLIGLFFSNQSASDDIVFESSSEENTADKVIMVDIQGAVVSPGLHKLPLDARLQDGLVAAGGLSASADREYVSKNLNLASKLTDGGKIYIPAEGEAESTTPLRQGFAGQAGITGNTLGELININSASEGELDTLPGIGPVTAQKIISGRPYNSTEDLINKKIVGSKVYEQIKDKISAY